MADGARPVKIATVVGEHTRECPGGLVERNITGEDMVFQLVSRRYERGSMIITSNARRWALAICGVFDSDELDFFGNRT